MKFTNTRIGENSNIRVLCQVMIALYRWSTKHEFKTK